MFLCDDKPCHNYQLKYVVTFTCTEFVESLFRELQYEVRYNKNPVITNKSCETEVSFSK